MKMPDKKNRERFMGVAQEDKQIVGETKEDAKDWVRWMIH